MIGSISAVVPFPLFRVPRPRRLRETLGSGDENGPVFDRGRSVGSLPEQRLVIERKQVTPQLEFKMKPENVPINHSLILFFS